MWDAAGYNLRVCKEARHAFIAGHGDEKENISHIKENPVENSSEEAAPLIFQMFHGIILININTEILLIWESILTLMGIEMLRYHQIIRRKCKRISILHERAFVSF